MRIHSWTVFTSFYFLHFPFFSFTLVYTSCTIRNCNSLLERFVYFLFTSPWQPRICNHVEFPIEKWNWTQKLFFEMMFVTGKKILFKHNMGLKAVIMMLIIHRIRLLTIFISNELLTHLCALKVPVQERRTIDSLWSACNFDRPLYLTLLTHITLKSWHTAEKYYNQLIHSSANKECQDIQHKNHHCDEWTVIIENCFKLSNVFGVETFESALLISFVCTSLGRTDRRFGLNFVRQFSRHGNK
jgi:hypothetical protein